MSEHASCPDDDLLTRLARGALPVSEGEPIARHVQECQRCRQAVADMVTPRAPMRSEDAGFHPELVSVFQTRSLQTGAVQETPVAAPVAPSPAVLSSSFPFLAPPSQPDSLGRLGPYEITRLLGQGAMGMVFLADDPDLGRPVAVKVMSPDLARDPFARQRFVREARATAAVSSPHIVTIYRVSQANEVPYLVMEYLRGDPLDRWLERAKKLTPAQAVRLGREIASGLAAAHEAGLVHRDIKPANIFMVDPGLRNPDSTDGPRPKLPSPIPKILDFGLARSAQENLNLTQSGLLVGTPAYMAPEQADGEPVDARSDLFSLGCLLYRLCTGEPPFAGPTVMAVLKAIGLKEPPPPCSVNPALPLALSDLIVWLLDKNPARRPRSAREVEQMLATIEKELEAAGDLALLAKALPGEGRVSRETPVPEAGKPTVGGGAGGTAPVTPMPKRAGQQSSLILRGFRQTRRRLRGILFIALGLAFGAAITLALTWSWAKRGHLELYSDAGTARVLVERDGQPVAVLDTSSRSSVMLPAGEYGLSLEKETAGMEVTPSHVRLGGGDRLVVRVRRQEIEPVAPDSADEVWRQTVIAMPPAAQVEAVVTRLRARNPDFKDRPNFAIEEGAVARIHLLSDNVTDLSPIRALPGLWALWCHHDQGMGRVTDLAPLHGTRLRNINVGGNEIHDLSPLDGMPLQILYFPQNPVRDLSPLRGMPLEVLSFSGCQVRDLSPIAGMPLRHLNTSHNPVASLAPLAGGRLDELICDNTAISDLSPLKGLSLRVLKIRGTAVTDLSILKELPLKEVTVDIRSPRDLAILRSIPSLEKVNNRPAAQILGEMERDLAALPEAENAVMAPPADVPACLRFSRVLQRHQRTDRAEALLTAALAGHPDNVPLLRERGLLYVRAAHWPAAAEDYEKAYDHKPDQAALAQAAACLQLQAGNRDAYRRICARALKDHATNQELFDAGTLAHLCLLEPGTLSDAEIRRLIELIAKGKPGTTLVRLALGLAYYRTGHLELAVRTLEVPDLGAFVQEAWGLEYYLVLAMAHHRLGNSAKASIDLERATHGYEKQILRRPAAAFVPLSNQSWWDTVSFLILQREAEGLLGG